MKHTKTFVLVFLISIFFSSKVEAVTIPVIRRIATSTPTPVIQIQKTIDLDKIELIASPTPTKTLIQLPSKKLLPIVTLKASSTPTPTTTTTITATPEPTEEVKVTPTVEPTIVIKEDVKAKDNLAIWFLAVTIGLLLIIIVAQAWPKNDDIER